MQLGEYSVSHKDGFYIANEQFRFLISKTPRPFFGCALDNGRPVIVYEDEDGSIVKLSERKNCFEREVLLISKSGIFSNKEINIQITEKELYLFFSSYYKGKKMILCYHKNHDIRIFDFCDDALFQTLLRSDGSVVVLYQKGGVSGYSMLLENQYSDFVVLNINNPIKLFEFNQKLYVLSHESTYVLYDCLTHEKFVLPLVFHQKPYLYQENGIVYIRYRWMHRYIYYYFQENKIVFLKEVEY